ncbi:MAG: DUF5916 domain-containing protein [Polyangiaceae bacterium]
MPPLPAALPTEPPVAFAVRATSPVVFDGKVDEAAWTRAPVADAFVQKYPNERAATADRTQVRIVYDDEAIVFGIVCHQEGIPVIARLTRRDRAIESDRVTVSLDTRRDGVSAFEFSVNAAGVLSDSLRFNDTELTEEWDENWDARTSTIPGGWSAEIRIPIRILRFSRSSSRAFGLQVRRYVSMRQETDEWAYIPRAAAGEVSRYGRLEGLEGIRAKNPVELRPFVLGRVRQRDASPETLAKGFDGSFSAGLDLKWQPKQGLALDGSVNPDFSQVDADQLILNLQQYEIYLPEKRPFFLEGKDTFATPLDLLYTRRIGRIAPANPVLRTGAERELLVDVPTPSTILGATKLVGDLGNRFTVGTLSVLTARNDVQVEDSLGHRTNRLVDPLTGYNVVRLKRDVGDNAYVGVMATSTTRSEPTSGAPTTFDETGARRTLCPGGTLVPVGGRCFQDAYVGAVDGRYRSSNGDFAASGQLVASSLHGGAPRVYGDGTTIASGDSDVGGTVRLAREGGSRFVGHVKYSGFGRKLDFNDVGYMRRQNVHEVDARLEYRTLEPVWKSLETHTRFETVYRQNVDGLRLHHGFGLNTYWKLDNFWDVYAEVYHHRSRYDDREIGDGTALERGAFTGVGVAASTDPRKNYFADVYVGVNSITGGAWLVESEGNFILRPLPQLDIGFGPQVLFTAGEPRYVGAGEGFGQLLFGKLAAKSVSAIARATYTFTPRLTFQVYSQFFLYSGHYDGFSTYEIEPDAPRLSIDRSNLRPTTAPAANPDFQGGALNVNAVLRWEYQLGSTIYLVYTRAQVPDGTIPTGREGTLDFGALGRAPASNTLLLKLSHWFG